MQQGIVLGRFKQSNAFTFGDKLYLRAPSLKFAWFRKSCGKFYIHIHVNTPQNLYYFTLGKPRPLGILRIGCDYVTTVICNLTLCVCACVRVCVCSFFNDILTVADPEQNH